jgi:hypothetical protein
MSAAEGGNIIGRAVMFGRASRVQGDIAYPAPKDRVERFVVDLKRGGKCRLSGSAGGCGEPTARQEGGQRFAIRGAGMRNVAPAD